VKPQQVTGDEQTKQQLESEQVMAAYVLNQEPSGHVWHAFIICSAWSGLNPLQRLQPQLSVADQHVLQHATVTCCPRCHSDSYSSTSAPAAVVFLNCIPA
jgi:hypothetical protein